MNYKKYLCMIVVFLVFFSTIVFAGYSDIDGHWCGDIIKEFEESKYISSDDGNLFRPDDYITKAELCKVINTYFGYCDLEATVDENISIAIEKGYFASKDKANEHISREETCVIINRILNIDITETIKAESFKDVSDISKWAKDSVMALIDIGCIEGYSDGTLRMKQNVTRAEAIKILNKCVGFGGGIIIESAEESEELVAGCLKYNGDEIKFEKVDGGLNLKVGDCVTLSVIMPTGYEGQDVLVNVLDGDKNIDYIEEWQQIEALYEGGSNIRISTLDEKRFCDVCIKIEK